MSAYRPVRRTAGNLRDVTVTVDPTTDPLAAYRAERRRNAATYDRPVRRTGRPWLPYGLRAYARVWLDADGYLQVRDLVGATADLAGILALTLADEAPSPGGVLFADQASFAAARRRLTTRTKGSDRDAATQAWQLLRAMEVAESLPFTSTFPVLTKLMATHLWLPEAVPAQLSLLDPAETDEPWIAVLTSWHMVRPDAGPLPEQLFDGFDNGYAALMAGSAGGGSMDAMVKSERIAVRAARYKSATSAMGSFQAATNATDQANYLAATDQYSLDETLLSGQAAMLSVVARDADEGRVTAAITDGVLRASEGADVQLFGFGYNLKVKLHGFEPDGDTMLAIFRATARTTQQLLDVPDQIMAVQMPRSFFPASPGNRWLSAGTKRDTPKREVPLEVLLAGAPE